MKSEVIVLDRGPKQSPTNSHNDRNKDGAKLLLPLITVF